jgi:hypothetical protein
VYATNNVGSTAVAIDSGGRAGSIPINLLPSNSVTVGETLPSGVITEAAFLPEQVDGYNTNLLLWESGIDGYEPTVIGSGGVLNSGILPFLEYPIYVSYSPFNVGSLTID